MDLSEYLESRNISKKEFADMCGISPGAVSNYCAKKRIPNLSIAMRIKEVTKGKVSLHDLLTGKKNKS